MSAPARDSHGRFVGRGGGAALRIEEVDHGYASLVAAVFDLAHHHPVVHVGILDGEETHGGSEVSILDVATWMEFGTQDIPARSFIRAWFDEDEDHLREVLTTLLQEVVAGKLSKEQALEQLGQYAVGRIQQRISDGIPPPNAPSTIEKKGSSTPLIDTGTLRASVTYKVEDV